MDHMRGALTKPLFHAEGDTSKPMQQQVFLKRLKRAMRASGAPDRSDDAVLRLIKVSTN